MIQLADVIPGLAPPSSREPVSETIRLPIGPWSPAGTRPAEGHLGYFVARGLLLREVCIAGNWSAELLGRADFLRPWQEDSASFVDAEWEVVEPVTLAAVHVPPASVSSSSALLEAVVEATMRRSRSAAVNAAISATPRVEERLLLLLWHVAEMRGERTPDGAKVALPVTHDTLGKIVGARRPTVTTALGALAADGRVLRDEEGHWVLRGGLPYG